MLAALAPGHLAAASVLAAGWGTHATALRHRLERARRDPLTGLHTRDAFTRRATRLLASGGPVLVVLVDLDRFKPLNDTHGHAAGDAVLAAAAARLSAWAAPHGATGRLGGDEFAAALPAHGDPGAALAALHHALTRPVHYAGHALSVGASIGATLTAPGAPLPQTLSVADGAMYTAKAHRCGWHLQRPGQRATSAPRWKRNHPNSATPPTTRKD